MDPGARSQGDVAPAPIWPGLPDPLGATWSTEATNFAVHAPDATAVEICLFDADGREARQRLPERTHGVWHGALPGVQPGQEYGFRAHGPWVPERGLRFDPAKLLLDPYARAVAGDAPAHHTPGGFDPGDSASRTARSVLVADRFDWGDDTPPAHPWSESVVYELHVKGFTRLNPAVPAELRGTYAGLASAPVVDYLRDLGVTAVELLPVHQFFSEPAVTARGLTNYWGYNSIGFFAPHNAYSATGDRGEQVTEFKAMVRSLHRAGIEVILDVVYNHTAEGGPCGPMLSFRGLDGHAFYKHADAATYLDVTGCGNTVEASYPPALRLILDSLRYWVTEMHVDGFRFDLASALARTGQQVDLAGPFMAAVGQDPVLRRVKLVAEPWDATAEGYQVGRFPPPWGEWNDKFRDTVRDFWRGRSDGIRTVASRLSGSSDIYARNGRAPTASVNYVTAHDGLTLRDLVSYDTKHNEANGEHNRDGTSDDRSWNCGVEGETDDAAVVALRHRQAANLLVTLCLTAGVPMICAGDERGRTQRGNNNAYVQDNEVSWVDWNESSWQDLHELTRAALRLRRDHPVLRQPLFLQGRPVVDGGNKDLAWVHPTGREMTDGDWFDGQQRTLGMFLSGSPLRAPGPRGERLHDASFLLWFNARAESVAATLPERDCLRHAEVVLRTDPGHAAGDRFGAGESIELAARSVVVLRQV